MARIGSKVVGKRAVDSFLIAAALVLPVGLAASPAGTAATASCATESGTTSFSPALPKIGDPTTVLSTSTGTIGGCVGLGAITGGTVVVTGAYSSPANCATFAAGGQGPTVGGFTVTWNTGQTSTGTQTTDVVPGHPNEATIIATTTGGLGQGTTGRATVVTADPAGACISAPLSSATFALVGVLVYTLPQSSSVSCMRPHSCDSEVVASATASAPELAVEVTGTPAVGTGTVHLNIASGTLVCPKVPATVRPVANLTDTGFAPTDRLTVTATLPLASSTSAEQVCFNSTVPFKSQSSPTAGTAFLLNCNQVANVAPRVTSSQQVGDNVVVKFVVPGADPTFCIVSPTGREAWASQLGTGTIGTPYDAQVPHEGRKGAVPLEPLRKPATRMRL